MFDRHRRIADVDPEVWSAITQENRRQEDHIELIASENYTSPAVMEAQGSQLTNKYAEGYPGKRYYGGCEYVDIVETLAIDRAKALFGADAAFISIVITQFTRVLDRVRVLDAIAEDPARAPGRSHIPRRQHTAALASPALR